MILRPAEENELFYIRELYEISFPNAEKKPFSLILKKASEGKMEILVLIRDEIPVGLIITILHKDLVLLDYFAVDERHRGNGIGSEALKLFRERYKNKRLFLEIEIQDDKAENSDQRRKRKAFYLRNGLYETGLLVTLFGVDMEILVFDSDCTLSFEEYHSVYLAMGKKIASRCVISGFC